MEMDPEKGSGDGGGDPSPHETRPQKRIVTLSERKFDVSTLPADMRRVYSALATKFDEEYALLFIFVMRTAIELHRAWHMTLLTSTILQQVKDEFGLRMTWNLGVVRLKFRVEDGGFELHRKVPYDYDSEYQDIYQRIALALVNREISVDEALRYQNEVKKGLHTAGSGLFLRSFPGRLVVYPLQSSMCAVIFFSGDWMDAGVAAITGLCAGILEYGLSCVGGQATILTDVVVGLSTGIIGGLWYSSAQDPICLSAVFLGTLYWYFYGTAFVIGLLEIIAGELETGVTRFVAVSVKTFVLSLGASLGLMMAVQGGALTVWQESQDYCHSDFVTDKWFRIPVYLLCSVGVLGQYRMRIDRYWCALIIQWVAYEVQYQVFNGIGEGFTEDYLDTAASNIAGAAAGVVAACLLAWGINIGQKTYGDRLIHADKSGDSSGGSKLDNMIFSYMRFWVKVNSCLRINRQSELKKLTMEEKLKVEHEELNNPSDPRERINMEGENEELYLETVVGSQDINIWSILMPAVYQLVPGSVIAKFWFHSIFPPNAENEDASGTFSNLFVISTSLALGLIFGFAIYQSFIFIYGRLASYCWKENTERRKTRVRRQEMMGGMYTAVDSPDDDPTSSIRANESKVD